jgi:hypothetical protein
MGQVLVTVQRSLGVVAIAGLFAGCTTAAQRQYQTAVTDISSEQCRALQAVVEDRERYGIVAPSRDLDEDALRQCGLPHSGGGGPPFQQTQLSPSIHGVQEVKIERRGDTYRVPVRINDTITLPFLLDTGATDLVIPVDVALTLIRAGALASGDFIGRSRYRLANGSEEVSDLVVLRQVQVGEHAVSNVTASISPLQGEPCSAKASFRSSVLSRSTTSGLCSSCPVDHDPLTPLGFHRRTDRGRWLRARTTSALASIAAVVPSLSHGRARARVCSTESSTAIAESATLVAGEAPSPRTRTAPAQQQRARPRSPPWT